MKSTILAVAAVVLLSGVAHAADIPAPVAAPRAPAAPVVAHAPAFSWTGFYAGAHLGWGYGNARVNKGDAQVLFTQGYTKSVDAPDGIVGGPFVGFNYQLDNNVVLGVEADYSFSAIKGKAHGTGYDAFGPMDYTLKASLNDFGTVRGRIGYAMDRWMPYVTAGWAYGEAKSTFQLPAFGVLRVNSNNHNGWVAGAGLDYALTDNVILRGEALYVDLGEKTYGALVPTRTKITGGVVRAGVSYKF